MGIWQVVLRALKDKPYEISSVSAANTENAGANAGLEAVRSRFAEDPLGISAYARGLASFISNADTPMTISIQGDWGVGKTTMMRMIDNQLQAENRIIPIWFNTWQCSQFNLGDQLPMLLLSHFVSKIAVAGDDKTRDAHEMLKGILKGALRIGGPAAKLVGVNFDAERLEKGIFEMFFGPGSVLDEFDTMHEKLRAQVEKSLKNKNAEKVVTFIDDLDRLDPEKAVELLGALKVFLDIPGCVFVIACDYEVIKQGVEKKFKIRESRVSGKSFFDKVFQLSFRMPVGRYKHEEYLSSLFAAAGLQPEGKDLSQYVELLRHSIGFNPRNIKRLVNNLTFLNTVMSESDPESRDDETRQRILFAVVCMESAFNQFYQRLLAERGSPPELGEFLKSLGDEVGIAEWTDRLQIDSDEKEALVINLPLFIGAFTEALRTNDDKELSAQELNVLRSVLELSSITAMQDVETEEDLNRDSITVFCRSVKEEIKKKLGIRAPSASSRKAILGRNNSRDYRLWFKPQGAKKAWSQWTISYGLDFDRNKDDDLSVNLVVWDEAKNYGLQPEQIGQLQQLSIVRTGEFDHKKREDGGVSVERNLGPAQFHGVDEAASVLAKLIQATSDLFDVPTEVSLETKNSRTGG